MLDFAAARDDKDGIGDNRNSKTEYINTYDGFLSPPTIIPSLVFVLKLQSNRRHQHNNTVFVGHDAPRVAQPTASKQTIGLSQEVNN